MLKLQQFITSEMAGGGHSHCTCTMLKGVLSLPVPNELTWM
jgi:hypothetical protein